MQPVNQPENLQSPVSTVRKKIQHLPPVSNTSTKRSLQIGTVVQLLTIWFKSDLKWLEWLWIDQFNTVSMQMELKSLLTLRTHSRGSSYQPMRKKLEDFVVNCSRLVFLCSHRCLEREFERSSFDRLWGLKSEEERTETVCFFLFLLTLAFQISFVTDLNSWVQLITKLLETNPSLRSFSSSSLILTLPFYICLLSQILGAVNPVFQDSCNCGLSYGGATPKNMTLVDEGKKLMHSLLGLL